MKTGFEKDPVFVILGRYISIILTIYVKIVPGFFPGKHE
jgi:hypothetical protein